METGQPAKAADAFATALAENPSDPDLMLVRAQALSDCGRYNEARELLATMPGAEKSAPRQSLLGDIEEKSGNFREAAEHYARAVQIEPTEANVWILGLEFLRHLSFDAAIPEFEAAEMKFPQSPRIKLGMGVAYFGSRSYAKSIPVFADLLGLDPGNALYAELLGLACTKLIHEEKPRCQALISYAQTHPRDAKASTYAATVLLEDGRAEQLLEARKLLAAGIAADPKMAEPRYQLGILQQKMGDWAASIPNLESALTLKPGFAGAHYRLALAYSHCGQKQQAQRELALYQQYHEREEKEFDRRIQQITTLLVEVH